MQSQVFEKLYPNAPSLSSCAEITYLERLYPDLGPIHGGEVILIVGKDFEAEERLTIHFGPNPRYSKP